MTTQSILAQVLDLSRWAPSGDNTQPWRFEPVDDQCVVVHGHDTRDDCVYDLEGHASQLSIGALLETMRIAASVHGWAMMTTRREGAPERHPTFDVRFQPSPLVRPDPLAEFIVRRTVQRRPMSMRALSAAEKQQLESAVGTAYRVAWLEGHLDKLRAAVLMFRNARIRLTTPEAFAVHRQVIQWDSRESPDRVPDQALGVGAATLALMKFVMQSWERVHFFNRFLAGTWIPRLQMDLLPGLACGAHLVIFRSVAASSVDDRIVDGRAVQRLWLTATRLGLFQQPEMTPLVFAEYARTDRRFTRQAGKLQEAKQLRLHLCHLLEADPETAIWMGRIGAGKAPQARSVRRPLAQLLLPPST